MTRPWARFDDLRAGESRLCPPPSQVLGELTETTTADPAVRIGGRCWTPPASSGCLPGVERARLLAPGRLHERVLLVDDLRDAEQVAVLDSLRGRRPAELLGGPRACLVAVDSAPVAAS